MAYIFLDESGDLGFDFSKKKTTKYFLVTLLFVENKRPIEKLISKLYSNLRKKYKIKSGVLHASKEEPVTCSRFCKKIIEKDCKIMTIYLNKKRVYTKLQNEKAVLYNYVVNILLDRIATKKFINKGVPINFIASRRETSKFLNLNFKNYLENQVRSNHKLPITVKIKTPAEEKCLQAVDFVSWSIFRKYEYGDDSYYNIIRGLVIEENPLFS